MLDEISSSKYGPANSDPTCSSSTPGAQVALSFAASQPRKGVNLMKTKFIAVATLLFIAFCSHAQTPKPIDLIDQAETVAPVSAQVKAVMALDPQRRVVVDGVRPWTAQVLAARELVFRPGSRLVFTDSTASAGHFFVVADRITIEDPNNPGFITWERTKPVVPPDRGQAGAGGPGQGEGASGGGGATGASGNTGIAGTNAPELTIMVRTVVKGGLVVDMVGGQGGTAGTGQTGGNGGAGAQGSSARQARQGGPFNTTIWLPYCESGPGRGGDGGSGGVGGPGGTGGRGGAGGNVTLVSTSTSLPTLFTAIRVNLGGGTGGDGGAAGGGGQGGAGGPEGPLANFCNSAGRSGTSGQTGGVGAVGQRGDPGRAGQPFIGELRNDQFVQLFAF